MPADEAPGRDSPPAQVVHYPKRRLSVDASSLTGRGSGRERISVYRSQVEPAYHRFVRGLTGWVPNDPADCDTSRSDSRSLDAHRGLPDIGLLTFPNSGTSWFARVALEATGICRHTVYRDESAQPVASRGAFALHAGRGAALPSDEDPVLIKSHVRFFASGRNSEVAGRPISDVSLEWRRSLPAMVGAIRLVRNPVDNVRARYHHHIKKHADGQPPISFSEFLTDDITNYLVWHTCCDLSLGGALRSLDYDELLQGEHEPFLAALRYAGYKAGVDDVKKALLAHPPKYQPVPEGESGSEFGALPVHLHTYSVDDLQWLGARLQQWTLGA